MKKKAGKKAEELDEKWGPVNEDQFLWLSEEILVDLLKAKMSHPESNAGIIIDDLKSKLYNNELFGLKCIMKACEKQAL